MIVGEKFGHILMRGMRMDIFRGGIQFDPIAGRQQNDFGSREPAPQQFERFFCLLWVERESLSELHGGVVVATTDHLQLHCHPRSIAST